MSNAQVGVLVIHGIGSQTPDFAAAFVSQLSATLEQSGIPSDRFAFEPVYWADILAVAQRRLLDRLATAGRLDWRPLRMFVAETMADAVAYRRGHPREWDIYHQVHWRVYAGLAALRAQLADKSAPLVGIGHSLGSVILSDHIWDEQKGEGFGRDPFTRCETLAGLITFGSNIPLFTTGLQDVRCIRFPPGGPALREPLRRVAEWRNYYDRDDVLGFPLRPLSLSYGESVTEDAELNSGNLLESWNPLSHNGYWKERQLLQRAAMQLANVHAATNVGV
jgi:hypothetical protein